MKYVNLIKLLSVLLCAVMLFSACSKPEDLPNAETGTGTEAGTQTEAGTESGTESTPSKVLDPVEPKLENFFKISERQDPDKLGAATRFDGDYYNGTADGALTVFKKSDVDYLNVRTDTYTVYNAKTESTVLSVTHSYTRGDYASFDWEDLCVNEKDLINGEIPKYPENILDVRLLNAGRDFYVIEVRRAIFTALDEEAAKENEGDYYRIETLYEYYDVTGKKLCDGTFERTPQLLTGTATAVSLLLGDCIVNLDPESGAAQSVATLDNEVIRFGFTGENARYGYYHGTQTAPLGYFVGYVDVYAKKDSTRVLRYYLDASDEYVIAMLSSDNLLIQYRSVVEEDSGVAYDYEVNGTLMSVKTCLVEIPTGKVTEIACDYVIGQVWTRDAFLKAYDLDPYGIALTDNVPNIGIATKIEDKKLDRNNTCMTVFNNDGSVMFAMEKIVPEQRLDENADNPFGFAMLRGGDYLVDLEAPHEYVYAVVKQDGTVRSYLKDDAPMWITSEWIVMENGIYDHDMNLVYTFAEENGEESKVDGAEESLEVAPTLELVIGDRILVSREVENEETGEFDRVFFELTSSGGAFVCSSPLFESESMSVWSSTKDYFVLKSYSTGKYTLYNADLGHVLTTANPMRVAVCDERYIVTTELTTPDNVPVRLYYTIGQ